MIRLYGLVLLLAISGCKRNPEDVKVKPTEKKETSHQVVEAKPVRISYSYYPLNDSTRRALHKTYDSSQLKIILAVNRIDEKYLYRIDTLVVPDTFANEFNVYSPFPKKLSSIDSVDKLLLCSYPSQAVAAYEKGELIRWAPASLGKKSTPTPHGLFHTNWKSKRTVSTVNEEWILNWYFNLTNFGGVSLHQYELPGYPASHSCVRLREEDAKWIYYWAEQWRLSRADSILARGTPVIVYGSYDFKARKPWLLLPNDKHAMDETDESLRNIISPYLSTILQEQKQLDSVKAARATPTFQARN